MFFFVRVTTLTVRSGPRSFDLPFTCEHCHKRAIARVVAEGICAISKSFGRPIEAVARQGAEKNALAGATLALATAPCPYCQRFASDLVRRREADRERENLKARRRWPWTIRAAIATLVPLVIAAIYDASGWLLGAALGASTFAGALTLSILSQKKPTPPMAHPPSVQFFAEADAALYRDNAARQPLPQPPPPSLVVSRGGGGSLSTLAMAVAGAAALVVGGAAMMWLQTFKLLHVVSASGAGMTVSIDGKVRGVLDPQARLNEGKEAVAGRCIVRPGVHSVRVVDAQGEAPPERTFEVRQGGADFVYAPGAAAGGACVIFQTAIYGARSGDDRGAPETAPDELWELPSRPDYVWKAPPASMTLQSGEEKRVTALRLTRCSRP